MLNDSDYAAIEEAVLETARGRWFLAEYARRNRQADTQMLLTAIARLEDVIRGNSALNAADRLRGGLIDMAKAIAQTRAEIAAIKPPDAGGRIDEAKEELDSIVQTTEQATSDILAAAEQIQEIAWTAREQGLTPATCDFLDRQATDIYTACAFQDLTGQRTRKVIAILRYLEARIQAMIDIWGADPSAEVQASVRPVAQPLLSGPAKPGQGLAQADVDRMMRPVDLVQPQPAIVDRAHMAAELMHHEPVPATAATNGHAETDTSSPPLQPTAEEFAESSTDPDDEYDPLAPIKALSYEERIALFS
jgi:chemotaxis regulatin CheY-phosphate phosphatase CheZ